ncbi:hypothetical protein DW972_13500 [Anaerobutyricum hallii]|uniref:Uncharacterized protein n=1 Tax=Anaerobutyricum hallii TaxID=39488 RepID=A0A413PQE0_9FIRM|nr:hypothetical protein DW972_13500 [Anaerobutyricum hallii]
MHYQENVSFLVKKFCESGKCRKFPEKNNRIAGLRCEYFIKIELKNIFLDFFGKMKKWLAFYSKMEYNYHWYMK